MAKLFDLSYREETSAGIQRIVVVGEERNKKGEKKREQNWKTSEIHENKNARSNEVRKT